MRGESFNQREDMDHVLARFKLRMDGAGGSAFCGANTPPTAEPIRSVNFVESVSDVPANGMQIVTPL